MSQLWNFGVTKLCSFGSYTTF